MHARHYCHNCNHFSDLRDGVYCDWCLSFWYANRRMPLPTDTDQIPTAIDRLWAKIDAMGES